MASISGIYSLTDAMSVDLIFTMQEKQFFRCSAFSFLFKNTNLKKCVSQIVYFYYIKSKVVSN